MSFLSLVVIAIRSVVAWSVVEEEGPNQIHSIPILLHNKLLLKVESDPLQFIRF